ncbi:hypothetical protein NEHOM01_0296 [Nematocida homosporus]|uniref:uncharacterized protein n=1 Tax=Nematocida homosporus TaxID=1912981 RepID=UPI00221F7660|nr:uncharacterized protein NEHOM01_0296 [Nematocida homosporus]KAI5184621.1 hypothetical protein NEHOM01_0296 [Nematocida homosporus]
MTGTYECNEVLMKLHDWYDRIGSPPGSFDEAIKKLNTIVETRSRQLHIFFFLLLYSRTGSGPFIVLNMLERISEAKPNTPVGRKLRELLAWPGPDDGLSPVKIMALTIRDIKQLCLDSISSYLAKELRLVAKQVAELGDIPNSTKALVRLPGCTYFNACLIMEYVWGEVVGIPIGKGCRRVLARLGWLSKSLTNSRGVPTKLTNKRTEELISRRFWPYVYPTLTKHAKYVCFSNTPNCEQCVVNDYCPSSRTKEYKVHRYVDSLYEQGVLPRPAPSPSPEQSVSSSKTLYSFSESESEEEPEI